MNASRQSLRCEPGSTPGGSVLVPGDKSISHRSVMLGAIAAGTCEVRGFLDGADCRATRAAVEAMGVRVEDTGPGALRIHGVGLRGLKAPPGALDLGNSGTSIRLLAGLLCGQSFDSELRGDASLMRRPMDRIAAPLARMGAAISTRDGLPPLHIRGGASLSGIDYDMPVASAQVKSAILLAGLNASGPTSVREPAPTRDHTERMLEAMGCTVERSDGRVRIEPPTKLQPVDLDIPADFSSAAFFLVAAAAAPGSRLVLPDVGVNPTRTGLLEILKAMGANIRLLNRRDVGAEPVADIHVEGTILKGIEVPQKLVPLAIDEFPVLFVAAACAEGETVVTGAAELRHKESDRLAVMAAGLQAVGVDVTLLADGMRVTGGPIRGGLVDSGGDHRVAMAFAVAASHADGAIEIANTDNIATSYPDFVSDARSIGITIEPMARAPRLPVPVVAIDGPSGSGKGTISRRVARKLGFALLDSGALYRLVAFAASIEDIALDDADALGELARGLDVSFEADPSGSERVLLGGNDVTGQIRTETCGNAASKVAALPAVRTALVDLQRAFRRAPGLVADGRDMGTVIFPDAPAKIFLTASADERADRRYKQLKGKGIDVNLAALSSEIRERDRRDAERKTAPLKPADDAIVVDTTATNVDEVVKTVLEIVAARI